MRYICPCPRQDTGLTMMQMNGATAVLEARVALLQGERIRILSYLATIYLPVTATAVSVLYEDSRAC